MYVRYGRRSERGQIGEGVLQNYQDLEYEVMVVKVYQEVVVPFPSRLDDVVITRTQLA